MKSCVVASLLVLGACSKKTNDAAPAAGPAKPPEVAARVIVGACTGAPIAERGGVLGVQRRGGTFESITGTDSGFSDEDIQGGLLGNEPGEMQGGWGYGIQGTGGGPGGGYGTIGRGKYGTIGHGSGTGQGYGVGAGRGGLRGRKACVPEVRIGNASAQGDLDKAIIRRYIRQKLAQFEYCYEKQLLVNPALAGTISAQFVIDAKGTVISSKATGMTGDRADEVGACVADAIKAIQFPKPKGGGIVQVMYPFTFRVSGGDPPAAAPVANEEPREEGRRDGRYEMKNTLEEGHMGKAKPEPAKASEAALTAAAETLRGSTPALTACYAKALARAPRLGGSVAALVIVDAQGAVTASFASGVGDAEVETCLADAIRAVKFAPAEARMSCGLTLGAPAMPRPTIAALTPVVTITADTVSLDDKPMAKVADLIADTSSVRIVALHDALRAARQRFEERMTAATAHLRDQVVVRAAREVSARVLMRVLQTAAMAGFGNAVLFAETSPGVYEPAPGNQLVPVLGNAADQPPMEEPSVEVSVLLTVDDVWIGLTTGDRRQLKDLADLPAVLKEFKTSAMFTDRRDIEVAAEEQVPYARVIKVMDMCVAAGFTDVGFTAPNALAVRFKQ